MLREEAQRFAKQAAERTKVEAEAESDELEARAARVAEELRKEKGALRDHAFLLSHVPSANGVLRTRVRKQHLHR